MKRKTGKTTRLIDFAIQELFKDGCIRIPSNSEIFDDEYFRGYSKEQILKINKLIDPDTLKGNMAQDDFINRFENRLYSEHRGSFIQTGRIFTITK